MWHLRPSSLLLDLFTMISIINNIENRERHFSSHCALNYTVFISSLKLVRLRSEYHPGESFDRRIPADDTAEFAFFHLRCKISHCAEIFHEVLNKNTMRNLRSRSSLISPSEIIVFVLLCMTSCKKAEIPATPYEKPQVYVQQGHGGAVFCAAWSADGSHVLSGDDGGVVKLWEV